VAKNTAVEALERTAAALGLPVEDLDEVAQELFALWVCGQRRYPTLSQQNQEWYRRILERANKVNPSRDDLMQWFGLPHGTAQYLSRVFYDPEADRVDASSRQEILVRVLESIREASADEGLGSASATCYLTPASAKVLKALLVEALGAHPMAPPTLTSSIGVVRVTFSANDGLSAICLALGEQAAAQIRSAAGL
jgi:hypothetical protein